MTKTIKRLEESLAKIKTLGSRLSCLFLILFVVICITLSIYIVFKIFHLLATSTVPDFFVAIQLVSSSLDYVIFGVMLLVMRGIAKDVAKGRSPFTVAHAKRIKIIAWLFVVDFVLSAFVSPGFASVVGLGGLDFGLASDAIAGRPIVPVDARSIVGALVCFSLSAVWKYGALLQSDSDEFL